MNRRLLVRFAVSAAVGAVVAISVGVVTAKPPIISNVPAGAPITLAGESGEPLEFGLQAGVPKVVGPLPATATIQLTSFHAAAGSPAPGGENDEPWWNESVPRIEPVTQFDGGPLQAVNCLMAAGAMLARLGYGVVTTGSQMRALQDDQEGGTNYQNLQNAIRTGWGVRFFTGALTPLQLRALLYAGAGAVIDGVYGELPVDIRVQKSFTGRHAIYVDAFRPPGPDGPAAYYAMDPIGKTWAGYKGDWWPAEHVDRFASQLTGGRINTLWSFPGGKVPKDHPILPPEGYPSSSLPPGETPGPSIPTDPMPTGDLPITADPPVGDPPGDVPHFPDFHFETDVFEVKDPGFAGCMALPRPPGCPRGIVGITDLRGLTDLGTSPGAGDIKLLYANPIGPGTYQILFEPPSGSKGELWFWSGSGDTLKAASIESGVLDGKVVSIATIALEPAADYSFIASASGDGVRAISTVGSLKVGS